MRKSERYASLPLGMTKKWVKVATGRRPRHGSPNYAASVAPPAATTGAGGERGAPPAPRNTTPDDKLLASDNKRARLSAVIRVPTSSSFRM
ncbi:hypothetical protein EVAR_77904_1 [Eumeta japonica]|uniref:Uncharacterized protein n=1 Tax=Eumeta variegata TaxID=151549 RepID=A0A4C1ZDH0_EUMVA|nr:hypothetical protein EVAR_77904_1 [Eumeta japonica]